MDTKPRVPTTVEDPIAEHDANGCCGEPVLVLTDAHGPIPTFPRRVLDDHGHVVPLTPEERKARSEAALRTLRAIRDRQDDDPPETERAMMEGIDANRPPGLELFEGMY